EPEGNDELRRVWGSTPPLLRPPQTLVGVQLDYVLNAPIDFVVNQSNHWVYADTGFKDGDTVPGIVGYEVDAAMLEYSLPESISGSYTLLSASPLVDISGRGGLSNASV